MNIIGFLFSFILALILKNKGLNMGLSLLIAAVLTSIFAGLRPTAIIAAFFEGITDFGTIQLIILVAFISGLGFIMKKTGDLDLMIDSLNGIISNLKLLIVIIPALIGTLNIPGGAILSAPMVEKSAQKIKLNPENKNAINIFFRHIGFFIYPLYTSMIVITPLLNINVIDIIKYTFFVFIVGSLTAFVFFLHNTGNKENKYNVHNSSTENNFWIDLLGFLKGFLPVICILVLALIFNIPFHLAVIIGVLVAIFKSHNSENTYHHNVLEHLKDFLVQGIDYQLVITIACLMIFKHVIETTGIINQLTAFFLDSGIPLLILVTFLGLLTGFVSGVHVTATIILAPLFLPLFPQTSIPVYGALLFTTINIGYIISPLHLCLVLSNEYFNVSTVSLYLKLLPPMAAMLIVSILQVLLFA